MSKVSFQVEDQRTSFSFENGNFFQTRQAKNQALILQILEMCQKLTTDERQKVIPYLLECLDDVG
jgi:tRNA/tmRNA/rRNA uracil-C5-methylase (TrmA/RlmC/RlmD family)